MLKTDLKTGSKGLAYFLVELIEFQIITLNATVDLGEKLFELLPVRTAYGTEAVAQCIGGCGVSKIDVPIFHRNEVADKIGLVLLGVSDLMAPISWAVTTGRRKAGVNPLT